MHKKCHSVTLSACWWQMRRVCYGKMKDVAVVLFIFEVFILLSSFKFHWLKNNYKIVLKNDGG